ncbi:MAG: nuclear transport factor 2 family protein [Desulfobacterales bacterium]
MMKMLENYLRCLREGDAEKMASLFSENAHFFDEGPVKMNQEPISLNGREKIKKFFKNVFSSQGALIPKNVLFNGNAMRYDVEIGGILFNALGLMKMDDEFISEYRVNVLK